MFENVQPYSKKLDDGLIMKSVSSIEDVERSLIYVKKIKRVIKNRILGFSTQSF